MKIGIVDADLIGRNKHRFPNLACEKISGYWKELGAEVTLLMNYENFNEYDHVYVSKVFTDTPVPEWLKETENIHIGGTGFYFDKAPNLSNEIEHHMPDYRLYDEWIESEIEKARNESLTTGKPFNEKKYRTQFREYTDYCIGFITRGCFRKCEFCVNKKFDHVFEHSPLEEFYYDDCKKICLLDDNFLGCPNWRTLLQQLIDTKKPFKFKQGLDERLLTDEKCELLFNANYDGDFTFALSNTYFLSCIGVYFERLSADDQIRLVTRLFLRSKLIARLIKASSLATVDARQFLYMLSDSTYTRRKTNLKHVLKFLNSSDEFDFLDIINHISFP